MDTHCRKCGQEYNSGGDSAHTCYVDNPSPPGGAPAREFDESDAKLRANNYANSRLQNKQVDLGSLATNMKNCFIAGCKSENKKMIDADAALEQTCAELKLQAVAHECTKNNLKSERDALQVRLAECEAERDQFQRWFASEGAKALEARAQADKLAAALERIGSTCGAPDAGEACRIILALSREALAAWKAGK